MTFPATRRIILTELKIGSTDWANVSAKPQQRDNGFTIKRGRDDQASQAAPETCRFTLNNRDGTFSPRYPLSALYNKIGRNTPVRVSLGQGAFGLVLVEGGNGAGWTSDTVATSITGDTDIRVDMEMLADSVQSWTGVFDVASKWEDADTGRSWKFDVAAGYPTFTWYSLGTVASMRLVTATAPIPGPTTGRRALRVTIDVDNGAGGVDVRFYTAPNMAGTWTQLGSTVTQATTSAIFNGNAGTRFGAAAFMNTATHVTIYEGQLRNGIGGSLVANPKFYLQPLDPVPFSLSSFSDGLGNTWTMIGSADAARIWYGDVAIRFVGEMASFPSLADVSNTDRYVPVEAAGILRRLSQGTDPASTGLRDFIMGGATEPEDLPEALTSYWPLSGGEGTKYSLNLGTVRNGSSRFYAEGAAVFTYGIDMGPFIGSGMELSSTAGFAADMRGDIGTSLGNAALDFVFQSSNLGRLTATIWDYSGQRWDCELNTPGDAGTLQVAFTDEDNITTFFAATGVIPAIQDTLPHHLRFQVINNGADTDYTVYVDGVLVDDGTMSGAQVDGTDKVKFYYTASSPQTVMNLAHVTLWSHAAPGTIPTAADIYDAMLGYVGETAAERMARVAAAGGFGLEVIGDPVGTTTMGPQHSEGKLQQIRDAEDTDHGILAEARDDLILRYRTRASMYAQDPVLTLDYAGNEIADPFAPTEDDQFTRNIITAVNRDAGSFRLEKTTGPLSVQDPPLGVGPYHDEVTVNSENDAQLPMHAGWLLSLGTVDAFRFPTLTVDLANPNVVAAGLEAAVLAVDIGDLIRVTNAENAFIYDDFDLLVLGYEENINTFAHTITFNCAPALPFAVAKYDEARYDTSGSSLAGAENTTDITMSVVTAAGGAVWTQDAGAFPFDVYIGGERVRVTNITGASSPQSFTVTRSINGIVKSHDSGTAVRLWDTPRYAL